MRRQTKTEVKLPPLLQSFVDFEVAAGRYSSPSEVIADGLRLLQARGIDSLELTPEAKKKVLKGVEDAKRGRVADGPAFIASLRADLKRARTKLRPKRRAG